MSFVFLFRRPNICLALAKRIEEANSHRDLEVYAYNEFLCLSFCGVQLALFLCLSSCSVQLAYISVYEYLLCSVWPIYLIAVFSWPIVLCLSTCGVQLAFISVYEYLQCSVWPIYLIAVFSWPVFLWCSAGFISVFEYL